MFHEFIYEFGCTKVPDDCIFSSYEDPYHTTVTVSPTACARTRIWARSIGANESSSTSGKATPWASQDNPGHPCIGFVDWDNPG